MAACQWETDPKTGDLVIYVDGEVRGRIPNPDQIKMDQGKPGGSIIGLDDIKAEFERILGCGSSPDAEPAAAPARGRM